jgi:hypothetical protein
MDAEYSMKSVVGPSSPSSPSKMNKSNGQIGNAMAAGVMQVKVFNDEPPLVEAQVNGWLSEHSSQIKVMAIKCTESAYEHHFNYTVSIFYRIDRRCFND